MPAYFKVFMSRPYWFVMYVMCKAILGFLFVLLLNLEANARIEYRACTNGSDFVRYEQLPTKPKTCECAGDGQKVLHPNNKDLFSCKVEIYEGSPRPADSLKNSSRPEIKQHERSISSQSDDEDLDDDRKISNKTIFQRVAATTFFVSMAGVGGCLTYLGGGMALAAGAPLAAIITGLAIAAVGLGLAAVAVNSILGY